jgi:hypothetical protein
MKYAVEMGSGAMIYIPSFIRIGSGTQKLIGGIHRQHGDRISLLSFFQNKASRLKPRNQWTEGTVTEPYRQVLRDPHLFGLACTQAVCGRHSARDLCCK